MSWPVLVFDIESIPDIAGLRALRRAAPESSDAEVYAGWLQERKDCGQSDFTPLHLQRVVAISCVFRNAGGIRIQRSCAAFPASWEWTARRFVRPISKASWRRFAAFAKPM